MSTIFDYQESVNWVLEDLARGDDNEIPNLSDFMFDFETGAKKVEIVSEPTEINFSSNKETISFIQKNQNLIRQISFDDHLDRNEIVQGPITEQMLESLFSKPYPKMLIFYHPEPCFEKHDRIWVNIKTGQLALGRWYEFPASFDDQRRLRIDKDVYSAVQQIVLDDLFLRAASPSEIILKEERRLREHFPIGISDLIMKYAHG